MEGFFSVTFLNTSSGSIIFPFLEEVCSKTSFSFFFFLKNSNLNLKLSNPIKKAETKRKRIKRKKPGSPRREIITEDNSPTNPPFKGNLLKRYWFFISKV